MGHGDERHEEEDFGPEVLVVEDDVLVARAIGRVLRREGYRTTVVHEGRRALRHVEEHGVDLVCLDLNLPDMHGFDILSRFAELDRPPTTLVISGQSQAHDVVRALRLGAVDFVAKSAEREELLHRVERALSSTATRGALARRQPRPPTTTNQSPATKVAYRMAERVARTPSTSVLLLGETGVGKGVLARHIHASSARADGPFVSVNVAALPDSMVEAELFGSVKGAFTGAERARDGLIASADGGTLLLDEVFELKHELQAKLLHVLEEREFFPLGSDTPRKVDIRVVAATNRDPEKMVREGTLRSDLFYRLSTVVIHLSPLRERAEEIPGLATRFLETAAREMGLPVPNLSARGLDRLKRYEWPGNIRELRNVMERAMLMCDGDEVLPDHLGVKPSPRASGVYARGLAPQDSASPGSRPEGAPTDECDDGPPETLEEARQRAVAKVERQQIRRALELADDSPTQAAKLLGVSRSTLWEKMKRYDMHG